MFKHNHKIFTLEIKRKRGLLFLLCLFLSQNIFAAASAEDIAKSMAFKHLPSLLTKKGRPRLEDLEVKKITIDEQKNAHILYQQKLRDVLVFGGELIVHLNANGTLQSVTDNLKDFLDVDTKPKITALDAQNIAIKNYGCTTCLTHTPKIDLWVVRLNNKLTGEMGLGETVVDTLAYRVQLKRLDGSNATAMPIYFIDAHTGSVVFIYNNLQTGSVLGKGTSLYRGQLTFTSYQNGNLFYLEDTDRKLGIFDYRNGTSTYYRSEDTNNIWDTAAQKVAVDAHYGASMVYDYYLKTHGRRGIDNRSGPGTILSVDGATSLIASYVHYGRRYDNAYWDGDSMTYGDGDGYDSGPLATLDISGHEMTHGVTERTANLIYSGESGALNESWSDVFGAMVERSVEGESENTWKIGEDCYTLSIAGDAMRFMDQPHRADDTGFTDDDDPDHYNERYRGRFDSGGVHVNSGIANHVFYLLAKGGSHHLGGQMTGIGADDAAKIWYKALTTYLTSTTDFLAARNATLQAANNLFGENSTQSFAVARAWELVGVGSTSALKSSYVTNGNFEEGEEPWVLSGDSNHTSNGNYPHAGTGYGYLGSVNNADGALYQTVSLPRSATSTKLRFWLNVTSNETVNTAKDVLFVEIRDTSNRLLATLTTVSNLSKAQAGDYSELGPFDLAAYRGQNVRLQFRATTNEAQVTTFRIDDVRID